MTTPAVLVAEPPLGADATVAVGEADVVVGVAAVGVVDVVVAVGEAVPDAVAEAGDAAVAVVEEKPAAGGRGAADCGEPSWSVARPAGL